MPGAKFTTYIPQRPHDRPMDDRDIARELEQERLWHRLMHRGRIAVCACGQSFVDASKTDLAWRHEFHIKQALEVLENRLRGIPNGN